MNVLLNLRAYWLNRKYVRLYSGIGIGATMLYGNLGNTSPETVGENDLLSSFALEFRLIGLQVGNDKIYGKLEIGSTGTGKTEIIKRIAKTIIVAIIYISQIFSCDI